MDLRNIFNRLINIIKKIKINFWLWLVIILPYLFMGYLLYWHYQILNTIPESKLIIINKDDYSLNLYSYNGKLIKSYKIAIGKNFGNKKMKGDNKTPEGIFHIVSIKDSKNWSYDFEGDGLPPIKGAYGPYFLRLEVPEFEGIGIHGTYDNNSLGKRASHGCIRMNNDDIEDLKNKVTIGTVVIIMPSIKDLINN